MCVEIYREVYECKHARFVGRRGQYQSGIDIILRSPHGRIGLQAKKYAKLPRKIIEDDIAAADAASLPLALFLVATTARSDSKLLEWIEFLSLFREEAGLFPVAIDFWDDITQHIRRYPALEKFNVRAPENFSLKERTRLKDCEVVRSLLAAVNVDVLNEHLQNFPYQNRLDVAVMFDRYVGTYQHPGVFFHDRHLGELFSEFSLAWARAMPQDDQSFFQDTSVPGIEKFQSTGAQYRMGTFNNAPAVFKELQSATEMLSRRTQDLLRYVNEHFPELDVQEIGRPLGRELRKTMQNSRR